MFPDIQLEDSITYGGKIGYFFSSLEWLEFEVDAYNSNPNIAGQTIPIMGIPIDLSGADLQTTTAAVNLLGRYPGKRFEPYLGAGPALYFAKVSNRGDTITPVVSGLNVVAGARYFLLDWLALFTEYTFNYAEIEFEDDAIRLQATYRANQIHGGMPLHFR